MGGDLNVIKKQKKCNVGNKKVSGIFIITNAVEFIRNVFIMSFTKNIFLYFK